MKGVFLPFKLRSFLQSRSIWLRLSVFLFSTYSEQEISSATLRTLSDKRLFQSPRAEASSTRIIASYVTRLPLLVKTYQRRIRQKARESPSIGNHTSTPRKMAFLGFYWNLEENKSSPVLLSYLSVPSMNRWQGGISLTD